MPPPYTFLSYPIITLTNRSLIMDLTNMLQTPTWNSFPDPSKGLPFKETRYDLTKDSNGRWTFHEEIVKPIVNDAPDMSNWTTPSNMYYLMAQKIPSAYKEDIFCDTFTNGIEWPNYKVGVFLENSHWFAVVKPTPHLWYIYDSLGKLHHPKIDAYEHKQKNVKNMTSCKIFQSPNTAICGAYAILYCISFLKHKNASSIFNGSCRTVNTTPTNYQIDVYGKDLEIRKQNDVNCMELLKKTL